MVTWDEWATEVNKKLTELSNRIDYIARNMASETQIRSLRTDYDCLRNELIRDIYLEKMLVHIVKALEVRAKTKREVEKDLPDFTKNPLTYHAFNLAWEQFAKSGVIVSTSQGKGHPRTWQLSLTKSDK